MPWRGKPQDFRGRETAIHTHGLKLHRHGLQFRAEMFNIANHLQFGNPTVVWGNQGPTAQPIFGTIRQTFSPTSMRQIQFALKYYF